MAGINTVPKAEVSATAEPDMPEKSKVSVFPNPAQYNLTIESDDEIREVRIIDMVGRTMILQQPGQRQASLELNQLRNGIYFVRVLTTAGLTTERIQVVR